MAAPPKIGRMGVLLWVSLFILGTAHAQAPQRITVGYYPDARPFTYENESGRPVGYAVELCQKVIDATKGQLGFSGTQFSWVPVTGANRMALLRERKVQMVCAEPVTLSAQKDVVFSIPIFQGGLGALLRADAQGILSGQTFAVVEGAPAEKVLADWLAKTGLSATISRVPNVAAGVQAVLERKAAAFFSDRSILLDAVKRSPAFDELKLIDRRLTTAPVAIALVRGNDTARLAIDRALSRFFATKEFADLSASWFGPPDPEAAAFFRLSTLPE